MGTNMRKSERAKLTQEAGDIIDISPEEIQKWGDDISSAQGSDAKRNCGSLLKINLALIIVRI